MNKQILNWLFICTPGDKNTLKLSKTSEKDDSIWVKDENQLNLKSYFREGCFNYESLSCHLTRNPATVKTHSHSGVKLYE